MLTSSSRGKRPGLDELAFGLELGAALEHHRFALRHLGGAGVVGEHGEDLALLDPRAALDLELGDDAAGAGGDGAVALGLGAAGNRELAAVRHEPHLDDGDAERLLDRLGCPGRGVALGAVARQQVPRRDPQAGGGDEADGSDAACFHDDGSSVSDGRAGRARSMWRVMSMKTGMKAWASKAGSTARRQEMPSAMIITMVTAPSMSTSARNVAARDRGAEKVAEPFLDVGVERRGNPRDLRVAAGLRHHLGAQQDLFGVVLGEVALRHALEHGEQAVRQVCARELLCDLGAVALGDAGDQRLLGGEIAVEVAGAHPGFGADVLHRRAMKAGSARSSALLPRGSRPAGHGEAARWPGALETPSPVCVAVNENERSLS